MKNRRRQNHQQLLLTLLFLSACSCRPEKLVPVEDAGAIPTCFPTTDAGDEVCDGIDNDCDGLVDENLAETCSSACGTGSTVCVSGRWTACSARQPAPETCDGVDNDCNGRADDGIVFDSPYCYEGNTMTAGVGTCHPGVVRCVLGIRKCVEQVTPVHETCNGKDDDCDGAIDDGVSCSLPRDLRVSLRWSPQADVDLHLRNPRSPPDAGSWLGWSGAALPFDCFYANKDPLWYAAPEENPHLDHDDLVGLTPETTTVERLNLFDTYDIGVHMYNWSSNPDPISVVLTVECGGVPVATRSAVLSRAWEMWVVGTVRYSGVGTGGCEFTDDGQRF